MSDIELLLRYTKKLSVLYVEDEALVRNSTLTLLNNYFERIDFAVDGQDGFEKYINYKNEHSEYYDLIITDIKMPRLNGLDMSRKILKENDMQTIIITTGYSDNIFLLEAIDLGIHSFISKPIGKAKKLNKALYKASRAISDHKFVKEHYETIEKLK